METKRKKEKATLLDALVTAGITFAAMGTAGFLHAYYADSDKHALIGMVICFSCFVIALCIYKLAKIEAKETDVKQKPETKNVEKKLSYRPVEEALIRIENQNSAWDYLMEVTRND